MGEEQSYQVHLDNFDGPLDLLLHLIEKNKMDIYNIPIAAITEQYMHYLEDARQMDLEIASEFLLLAATLIQIKAKMLLPKKKNEKEENELDPREELVQRLLEYKFYKEAALTLQQWEMQGSVYMLKPVDVEGLSKELTPGNPVENVTLDALYRAFQQVMEEAVPEERASLLLQREEYHVEVYMEEIKDRLRREKSLTFVSLFMKGDSKRKIITIFLALLELCKLESLTFQQQEMFGTLWIFPRKPIDEVG